MQHNRVGRVSRLATVRVGPADGASAVGQDAVVERDAGGHATWAFLATPAYEMSKVAGGVPGSGRHRCLGTRPGSMSVQPLKRRMTSPRLRGHSCAFAW